MYGCLSRMCLNFLSPSFDAPTPTTTNKRGGDLIFSQAPSFSRDLTFFAASRRISLFFLSSPSIKNGSLQGWGRKGKGKGKKERREEIK